MEDIGWMNGPPRKILLATDLSARSDRALDRAVSLARQWDAHLVVLHVLEDPQPSNLMDPLQPRKRLDRFVIAKNQILADLGEVAASILVEKGDPAESILEIANRHGCDLIVLGIARNELLGKLSLGRTVDWLVRRSRVPLLVVKGRAKEAYRRIVVATDFSESSRHALDAAMRFFPENTVTLFHAYDPPMSGMVTDSPAYRREYRKIAAQDCESFLRDAEGRGGPWRAPNILLECGAADYLLHDLVFEDAVDLVVLGTHGHGMLYGLVIGSVAKNILDHVRCDTLVIREPQAKKGG